MIYEEKNGILRIPSKKGETEDDFLARASEAQNHFTRIQNKIKIDEIGLRMNLLKYSANI